MAPSTDRPNRLRTGRRALLVTALALLLADALITATGTLPSTGPHHPPVAVVTQKSPDATLPSTPVTTAATTSTTSTTVSHLRASGSSGSRAYPVAPTGTVGAASLSSASCDDPCVTIDATSATGEVDHAGAGVLFEPGPDGDGSQLVALHTTMFRSAPGMTQSGGFDWTSWDAAANAGIPTTLILSNLWISHYGGRAPTPWSNWSNYTNWVRSTVSEIVASGQPVTYWDIYNEPGWRHYYSQADFERETPSELLQQFLVTYQTIRSVDPSAAIIGPSDGEFALSPLPPNEMTHEPDLATFLRFAAAHNLRLAAVAWHDNGTTPALIYSDAQKLWSIIRSLPALGHPQMFMDEYGSPQTQPIPGWDVGYLAAIEAAHIASAVRSCWNGCQMSNLDGLLTDSGQPTSDYYLRTAYAHMSGLAINASTTTTSLAALGSVSSSDGSIDALIGRMASCGTVAFCQSVWHTSTTPPPPQNVHVSVVLPWNTPNISLHITLDPFQPGQPSSGPVTVTPVSPSLHPNGGSEVLDFTIPSVADGSAYSLVIQKA